MNAIRRTLTPLGLALLVGLGSPMLYARDEPAEKPSPAPAARAKADPSRRVPSHFGQIGLTIEQRESIYKIRKVQQERIDALKAQIAEVEAKSMVECEAVLTDTQKKLLENLRSAGARTSARPVESAKAVK